MPKSMLANQRKVPFRNGIDFNTSHYKSPLQSTTSPIYKAQKKPREILSVRKMAELAAGLALSLVTHAIKEKLPVNPAVTISEGKASIHLSSHTPKC